MSWFESVSLKPYQSDAAKSFSAEQTALAQVGALSPLWMLFAGASAVGIAYWGMTQWMRLASPERAIEPIRLRLVTPESEAAPEAKVVELKPAPAPKAEAPVPAPKVEPAPAPVVKAAAPKPAAKRAAKAPVAKAAAPKPAPASAAKAAPAAKTAAPAKPAVKAAAPVTKKTAVKTAPTKMPAPKKA